jgi:hypothetical protein
MSLSLHVDMESSISKYATTVCILLDCGSFKQSYAYSWLYVEYVEGNFVDDPVALAVARVYSMTNRFTILMQT